MVPIYQGLLFSYEEEGNPAICDNKINLEVFVLSEIHQIEKDKYCMVSLIGGFLFLDLKIKILSNSQKQGRKVVVGSGVRDGRSREKLVKW